MSLLDLKAILTLDSSEYEKGLKAAGGMVKSGLGAVAKAGAIAVGAATTAVGAFAASSVKAGATFDKSMSQVAATMGLSMEEMATKTGTALITVNGQTQEFTGNLRDFAREMGRNTAFSADEAAKALNYMALAGYDAQTSMNMLPNVLNLAAAGNFDLARASDMVTDTQTAFGLSLERTSQLVDEMAKASSTGNTSVEQLGDAFLIVGGLARELNGGMIEISEGVYAPVDGTQELTIALTAMANAGIKGSEAGTHMRNMLLKLSSPTSDGTKQLEALGVSVFDTEGNMRSLADIMGDLDGALGDLTQEQKIQAISDLFNTRDLASAEALLNAVGDDWTKIGRSILDAEGAAQKMADTQLDNLSGDITLFKSALSDAKIAISDQLTPALRGFVQFGTKNLSKLTEAFESGGLTGAMSVMGEALAEGLNMIVEMLPEATNAGMQLLGALGQGIIDNLPMIVDSTIEIVNNLVQGLVDAAPALAQGAIDLIAQLAISLGEAAPNLFTAAAEIVVVLVTAIINNIPQILMAGLMLIGGLAEGLFNALDVLLAAGDSLLTSLITAIGAKVGEFLTKGQEFVTNIANGIRGAIQEGITAIGEIITGIINAIAERIQEFVNKGMEVVTNIASGISGAVGDVTAAIGEVVDAIVTAITGLIDSAISWGKDLIDNFVGGISSGVGAIGDAVGGVATKVRSFIGFSEPEDGPLSDFHTYAPDMLKLFSAGISENSSKVTAALNNLTSRIQTIFNNLTQKAFSWGRDMMQQFISGINSMVGQLNAAVNNIANSVERRLGFSLPDEGPLSHADEWMPDMMKLLADGIRQNAHLVTDELSRAMGSVSEFVTADTGTGIGGRDSGFVQNITINAPKQLDASEIERQTRNANREMVLRLRTT